MQIFQAQWMQISCVGPPTSMFLFNEGNATNYYKFVLEEYDMGVCGNLPFKRDVGCCYSSLNGPKSGMHFPISSFDAALVPSDANGATYCQMDQTWVLANNQCIDGYKCTKQQLTVYADTECRVLNQTINFPNPLVKLSTFNGAQTKTSWTAFTPSAKLVPNFSATADYLGTGCFILALAGAGAVLLFLTKKYRERKTKYMWYLLFSQWIWLFWITAKAVYYFLVFPSEQSFAIYSQIMNVVFNTATLSTIFNSVAFLAKFHDWHNVQWFAYCGIGALHLVLSGALYFDYFRFMGSFTNEIKVWNSFAPFWIVFMIVFDTIPSISVTFALLKSLHHSTWKRFTMLNSVDKQFTTLTAMQLLTIVGYAAVGVLKNMTDLARSDRMFLGLDGTLGLFLVMHSILNCLFIEHVSKIAQLRTKLTPSAPSSPTSSTKPNQFSDRA